MSEQRPGDDPAGAGQQDETAVTILVVDDQHMFREAMAELIEAAAGCRMVGKATSGEEALEAVAALAPQVVIMDQRMPGIGGVEASRLLTRRQPKLIVLLVSLRDPDPAPVAACGASA